MSAPVTIVRTTYNDDDTLDAAQFNAVAIASASVPSATAIAEGVVQLAGDLTGTATVPAVAALAITTAKIANLNVTTGKLADEAVTLAKIANLGAGTITRPSVGLAISGPGTTEFSLGAADANRIRWTHDGSLEANVHVAKSGDSSITGASGLMKTMCGIHEFYVGNGTSGGFRAMSITGQGAGHPDADITLGQQAAMATNATTGFIYVRTCAGAPTGAVSSASHAAMVVDTTNLKLWFRIGSAWKYAQLS